MGNTAHGSSSRRLSRRRSRSGTGAWLGPLASFAEREAPCQDQAVRCAKLRPAARIERGSRRSRCQSPPPTIINYETDYRCRGRPVDRSRLTLIPPTSPPPSPRSHRPTRCR